jgi:hypothetical protein
VLQAVVVDYCHWQGRSNIHRFSENKVAGVCLMTTAPLSRLILKP